MSGTKGDKDNSNENLNYGFGIRMDIDFRVPEGGVIPGTNKPVTFEFIGDDDLWVYVTDNETGASQLVLDMGGAHKESHGVIDFSTKTATVDVVENNSNTEYGYVYLSKDNTGWGDTYAYFYNSNGAVGGAWPGTKMSTYESSSNLRCKIPEGATKVIFNNNSGAETASIDLESTGGAYWLSNTLGVNQWETAPSDAGIVSGPATKTFSFDNTDDQKTYTLSVFYMERGLIESNMKIAFTMTPLDNDLTVSKRVEAENVNPGIVDALTENEKFSYLISDDGASAKNVSYSSDKNGTVLTDTRGSMKLTHSEKAVFNAQFETGSKMNITESDTSASGVIYDTNWKLSDNNTGKEIESGTDGVSQFDLINSSGDENLKTSLYLEYVNTPKVAPVSVTKTVVDEDGNNISSSSNAVFNYTAFVDIFEGSRFENFDLTYKLYDVGGSLLGTYIAEGGVFSIQAGQKVVFEGIPVGAVLQIVEDVKPGYELSNVKNNGVDFENFSTLLGTEITVESDNQVAFTNTYKPVAATLTAYKTLGGENYTGTEFTFNCKGLPSMTLNGVKTLNTEAVDMNVTSSANGVVSFTNTAFEMPFTYGEAGTYCYVITEVNTGNEDFIYDDSVYYARVVVKSAPTGDLIVNSTQYYTDDTFTDEISAEEVIFANEYANCTVNVYKKNFNNTQYLTGAQFKLVPAVKDTEGNWVEDTNSNLVIAPVDVAEIDGENPAAVFEDVPQGDYLVIETKAPAGYDLSTKQLYLDVRRTNDNNGVVEFDFVDLSTSLLPMTGGTGVFFLGLSGAVLVLMGLGLFLSYTKRKKSYN